jgi:hypothetical protein
MLRFGSTSGSPILFANSFPKSGTHLLTQVLKGFVGLGPVVDSGLPAIVTFDGSSGKPRDQALILKEIRRLRNGDIAYGHLHAKPEIVKEIAQKSIAHFFIYRDPRDVVVSHVYYVTEIEKNHVHHDYYVNDLHGFDERLMTSILGRPDSPTPFPDIGSRFEPYLNWLEIPDVLPLRYENIVNDRSAALIQIINHAVNCGFDLRIPIDDARVHIEKAIDPAKSPTFRRGKVGKWKESFKDEHVKVFKDVCGDSLIRLGYESDNNW